MEKRKEFKSLRRGKKTENQSPVLLFELDIFLQKVFCLDFCGLLLTFYPTRLGALERMPD